MKKGQPMPIEKRIALSERNKTDNPGYQAIHIWVRKWGGKADYCEMADGTCKGRYEWSNISHKYKRDLSDYQQLCSSHHTKYDKTYKRKQKKEINAHLKTAQVYAELSYAQRLKVGAVLVSDNRIVSVGRNGTVSGADNVCEVDGVTKPEVVHAETNVIAFAAKSGVSTNNCVMVITDSPCYECSKLIIQSGIKEVYYKREYRDTSSLDFLRENNILVSKIGE